MLPQEWIPHRRSDGETLGWLEIVGDDVVAYDLLGRPVSSPGLDWHEAEQVLEERGIGYLAERYTVVTDEDELVPVRIGEATPDGVTVVEDAFGAASAIGAEPTTHRLPFPVPRTRLWTYVRPQVDLGTWLDEDGRPIPYGERWDAEDVPERMYSVCRHPERFAPIVTVAHALIDHLERTYDVERTQEVRGDRATNTLTPRTGTGAKLTFTLSREPGPGAQVAGGFRYVDRWPGCGCDACDEAVPDLLDDLERSVIGIVEGTMREWRGGPDGDTPWTENVELIGFTATSSWSADEPEPLDLPTTPHQWGPWPLRG